MIRKKSSAVSFADIGEVVHAIHLLCNEESMGTDPSRIHGDRPLETLVNIASSGVCPHFSLFSSYFEIPSCAIRRDVG